MRGGKLKRTEKITLIFTPKKLILIRFHKFFIKSVSWSNSIFVLLSEFSAWRKGISHRSREFIIGIILTGIHSHLSTSKSCGYSPETAFYVKPNVAQLHPWNHQKGRLIFELCNFNRIASCLASESLCFAQTRRELKRVLFSSLMTIVNTELSINMCK